VSSESRAGESVLNASVSAAIAGDQTKAASQCACVHCIVADKMQTSTAGGSSRRLADFRGRNVIFRNKQSVA